MKIVHEIIDELTKSSGSIESALLKTKVLAYKIGNNEIAGWVNFELNGYESDEALPEYRIVGATVYGVLTNGHYRYNHWQVPLIHLDREIADRFRVAKLMESITSLEHLANGGTEKVDMIAQPIAAEITALIIDKGLPVHRGYHLESSQIEIARSSIIQVVTSIRSKLLDFMLEVDKQVGDKPITDKAKEMVQAIFSGTITGSNNIIITGSHNVQKVNINVSQGNFEELSKQFQHAGLTTNDVQELQNIIDQDNSEPQSKKFGDKVNGWILKMITKVATGSWDIAIGAAGSLLADGISKYYGWS